MAYNFYNKGKSKYKAEKTVIDGITFDSKRESERYLELKLLEGLGEIKHLKLQVPFTLIPAQYETVERYGKNGQRLADKQKLLFRAVNYIADFVYLDKDGRIVVEDVKGFKTREYEMKKKLMYYKHKILIKEVK